MSQKRISEFISNHRGEKSLIVIYGPTACGKSALAIETAKHLESEIISVDARQIYRYMDIGTGKVTEEEKE